MLRSTSVVLAAMAFTPFTYVQAAPTIGYTAERSGDTWTFGDLYVGLVGFNATPGSQTISEADILADISAGGASRVVGLFNGVGNLGSSLNISGGIAAYEAQTFFSPQFTFGSGDNLPFSNGIDPFTTVELDADGGRYVSVFFVLFEGDSNLVFTGDVSGTATLNANGAMGEFPTFIPEPASAALLAAGLGLVGCRRRRRA